MTGRFGVALLDVNVLVALFDPEHIHHDTAHEWFGSSGTGAWATCPLTENGLVRVLSSPRYPGRKTTATDAAGRLRSFCEQDGHHFWPDSVTLRDAELVRGDALQGHAQVTDVYLLALAVANGGSLATLDRGIESHSAVIGAAAHNIVTLV